LAFATRIAITHALRVDSANCLNKIASRLLEARLKQNSGTSRQPPSSDKPWKKPESERLKTGRKSGGQKGHFVQDNALAGME
jgi:hypothetical protein